MQLFSDRIKIIRTLCNISQAQFATIIGVPQPNYARYETGITKKIPYSLVSKISIHFGISEQWLNNGEINQNYCYEIQSTIRLNYDRVSIDDLAKKLDVTKDFLEAITAGKISPSTAFFEKVMRTIGVEPQGNLNDRLVESHKKHTTPTKPASNPGQPAPNDYVKMLEYRIAELHRKLEEVDIAYDNLNSENEQLKAEIERLMREVEQLKTQQN